MKISRKSRRQLTIAAVISSADHETKSSANRQKHLRIEIVCCFLLVDGKSIREIPRLFLNVLRCRFSSLTDTRDIFFEIIQLIMGKAK